MLCTNTSMPTSEITSLSSSKAKAKTKVKAFHSACLPSKKLGKYLPIATSYCEHTPPPSPFSSSSSSSQFPHFVLSHLHCNHPPIPSIHPSTCVDLFWRRGRQLPHPGGNPWRFYRCAWEREQKTCRERNGEKSSIRLCFAGTAKSKGKGT